MPTGMEGDRVTVAFVTGDPAKARADPVQPPERPVG